MSVSKESAGGAAIMSQLETSGDARADGVLGGQGDDTVAGENAPGGGQAHNPVEVPIDGVLPNEAVGSAKDVPPRPPSPDDVAAMLKAAEHKTEQRAEKTGDAPKARLLQFITLLFLWGGLVIAIASAFYLLVYSGVDPLAALSATGVLIAADALPGRIKQRARDLVMKLAPPPSAILFLVRRPTLLRTFGSVMALKKKRAFALRGTA